MLWIVLSCGTKEEITELDLIDISSWNFIDYSIDPLIEHQPEEIDCSISAIQMEYEQLEMNTDLCNYIALEFETQKDILAGTTVEALILHTGLWALEDTEAHFALYINDTLWWEEYPPIPSNTEFFFHEATITEMLPKGTRVYLHLHNHGANDWKFGYFRDIATP